MRSPKLSVVIPCYNEEKRLVQGFSHFYNFLKSQNYSWEIILVNDGSVDKTSQIMKNLVKSKKEVKIISYQKNQGKGYAIVQGILQANGKYILFSDIDHSVPIETIANFFNQFEKGFKVVIGSRRIKGAKILIHQNPLREFLGRGFTVLVNIAVGFRIHDATCGFKAFENKIAKKIFAKINVYDWAFDAEILFLCKKYNLKIAQVPVTWSDVKGSKVSLKKDIVGSLMGLFKIRLNDLTNKYT